MVTEATVTYPEIPCLQYNELQHKMQTQIYRKYTHTYTQSCLIAVGSVLHGIAEYLNRNKLIKCNSDYS